MLSNELLEIINLSEVFRTLRKRSGSVWIMFISCAAVVGIWLFATLLIHRTYSNWTTSGQIGDTFGAVNALFSGLAFGGLIYTVYLQIASQQEQKKGDTFKFMFTYLESIQDEINFLRTHDKSPMQHLEEIRRNPNEQGYTNSIRALASIVGELIEYIELLNINQSKIEVSELNSIRMRMLTFVNTYFKVFEDLNSLQFDEYSIRALFVERIAKISKMLERETFLMAMSISRRSALPVSRLS